MTGETGLPSGVRSPRLAGVDVLRGLCVLLVLLNHIKIRFLLNDLPVGSALPARMEQVLFWSGHYAVVTFFVISGFLITGLSLRRWGSLGAVDIGSFYRMRFARIAPCLLLLLLILTALHLAGAPDFVMHPEHASLGRALAAALTFHVNWLEGHHGYLPGGWDVLWSLSVEEAFYLVFPLAAVLIRNERVFLVVLGVLVIIAPCNRAWVGDTDPWWGYAYLSCTDAIALGCMAALAVHHRLLGPRGLRLALVIGCVMSVLTIALFKENAPTGLGLFGFQLTALELGVALMVVAFGSGVGNLTMARGTRWLRIVGRCSYEIYLFHMLIVLGLIAIVRQLDITRAFGAWYAAMLVGSILLGYLIAQAYSEPLNQRIRAASGLSRRPETLRRPVPEARRTGP
ncbi:MAG TPA: acyltransferase [Steroidobacteraceae bacterium]|nr:acyltransferase [Steroidobacteraceae bacterium]